MHLRKIEIQNFACLKDVSVELTDLHALIGPNDSGKSTILRAVRLLTQFLAAARVRDSLPTDEAFLASSGSKLRALIDSKEFVATTFPFEGINGQVVELSIGSPSEPSQRWFFSDRELIAEQSDNIPTIEELSFEPRDTLKQWERTAGLLRLDPDQLRSDSELIPEERLFASTNSNGAGWRGSLLPGILDSIRDRDDGSFEKICDSTRDHFPTVRNLKLRTTSPSRKSLIVELTNGARVPASQVSEGFLYFLAYAALPYLTQPSILLVEEPENGLHPSRIRDVMNILREISKTTQVIIATHSPLVVNELQPEEVTVITRDSEKGTQARKLTDAHDFKLRSEAFLPGELWLNYANGIDEADLFQPRNKEP